MSNWVQAESAEGNVVGLRLTGESVSTIWSRMIDDGIIFRASWEVLTRHFLAPFFKGKAFCVSIAELRACYLSIPGAITTLRRRDARRQRASGGAMNVTEVDEVPIPEDANEFCRFIGKELLSLNDLPRDTLASLYVNASDDLALIETHISECQRLARENGGDLKQRSKSRGRADKPEEDVSTDDKGSWVRVYNYYAEMNHDAREEIIEFLSHPDRIRDEALRVANRPVIQMFDFHVPYAFRSWPERYHPSHFSDVENKFNVEPVRTYYAWCRCYGRNRKAFFTRLRCYVNARVPTQLMRDRLNAHHRLSARREVLEVAFDAYDRGQWGVFATLAVVQVEGLFLDYCEDIGVSATELQRSSLPSKMNAILRQRGRFSDYAYYAFRFPVIRNHLAHGRLLTDEAESQARLLMLDLRDVFGHVTDDDNDINALVGRLRRAAQEPQRKVDDALAISFFQDRGPPSFYGLDHVWNDLRALADSDQCVDFAAEVASELIADKWDDESVAVLQLLLKVVLDIRQRSDRKQRWNGVRQTIQTELKEVKEKANIGDCARSEYWRRIDHRPHSR